MEDKVVSIELGKFGIILTRRLLLYLVMVVTSILIIYVFVIVEEGHNHTIGECRNLPLIFVVPITGIFWSSFQSDCGLN